MSSLRIRPVQGRRDLKRFVKLPYRLHAGTPWVPPLLFERMQFLDPKHNPYFEHAEVRLFLAERDGEPVGRITAQVDSNWDEHQGGNDGMFGFFEAIEDQEVVTALLDTAAEWLRQRGRERMIGPMDFTTNDELGILIEGFEEQPMLLEPWHPPYYSRMIETAGYGKAMDLLAWYLEIGKLAEGMRFDPGIHEAAQKSLDEHGVTIRNMRKRHMEAEVARFQEVYNEAWGTNWGFVPITEAEVAFQAKNLKQILDEDWAIIAENAEGEVVGAGLSLPDVNQVFKKMNGRLLPFGWLTFLLGKRKIDKVRVLALGVKKAYQHTGIAAALYVKHLNTARPGGVIAGDAGWILETNEPMNRAIEGMGGTVSKKYRIYEKSL